MHVIRNIVKVFTYGMYIQMYVFDATYNWNTDGKPGHTPSL
jgi:hypothetical protein